MKEYNVKIRNTILFSLCFIVTITSLSTFSSCTSETDFGNSDDYNDSSYVCIKDFDFSVFDIVSKNENGQKVEVETSVVKFSYPSAFVDAISVKSIIETNCAKIQFLANLGFGETPVYYIVFGGDKYTPVGTLEVLDGESTINVQVEFCEAPKHLNKDDMATFNATQETFNDVLLSLKEDDRFAVID